MRPPGWLGSGAIAFLVLWLLLLTAGRMSFFRDPGTFWHTTTGEIILTDGFIRSDPYTFTFGGMWWIPYQWLGEVIMAVTHRLGGFDALLLGAVTIVAATYAWLTTRLLRTGLHPIAVTIVIALGLAASASHFHVRPLLATILFATSTMIMLVDVEMGRSRFRRLIWLLPLFVVWTNIHGGVLGGIATVGMVCVGWVIFWQFGFSSPVTSWKQASFAVAIAIGCGLTPFVNPYGRDLLWTWQIIMTEPALKQIIQEHRPVDVAKPYAWPIIAFATVFVVILAGVSRRELRVTWLIPLVWLVLAFDRIRHAPLFVVIGLVAITSMWPHTRWARWLARNRPDYQKPISDLTDSVTRTAVWSNLFIPAAVVIGSLLLQLTRAPIPVIGSGWARLDPTHWPVDLLDELKKHEPQDGMTNRIFNDYIDGGFIEYHTPKYRVFVDDRCEVFGGPWLVAFVDASHTNTSDAIVRWEHQYGRFDFALTRIGTGFDDYFKSSPEWICVKRGEVGAFYKRKLANTSIQQAP